MNPNKIRNRSIQNHIPLNQANKHIKRKNKPTSNSKNRGHFIRKENKHVIKQIRDRFSIFLYIDEKSIFSIIQGNYVWKIIKNEPMKPMQPIRR